jgi:hypothetical protein
LRNLICFAMAALLFAAPATGLAGEEGGVAVGKGSLKVGGILQAGYTYNLEDAAGVDAFTLNRARFLFWGTIVPDKVKYFVQTEGKGGTGVLDYKAQFFYVPQTEIAVGRFLPNFTYYMPISTAKLEMINYPLLTQNFAMWRQSGIQTTTKTEFVDFNVGIFNGADLANNVNDNNDSKDFLVRADFKPPVENMDLRFGGYAWIGAAMMPDMIALVPVLHWDESTLKNNTYGGFAKLDYAVNEDVKIKIRGEFALHQGEQLQSLTAPDADQTTDVDSQAFYAHIGIQPNPEWEFLFRYDNYDQNTDQDNDGYAWMTGGVNYYIDAINAMFYLNYIHKANETNDPDDDVVMAQVQVCF